MKSNKKLLWISIPVFIIGIVLVIWIVSSDGDYYNYLSNSEEDVALDFTDIEYKRDWYLEEFTTDVLSDYTVYELPEYDYNTVLSKAPSWLTDGIAMYPDDYRIYLDILSLKEDTPIQFMESSRKAYYQFGDAETYVVLIDDIAYAYTFKGSEVYEYKLTDEILPK